ncbi:MAG: hypothetical protein LBN18_01970 [Dysgonamonadaceae bacterium]|jgi:Spy/CpxP family protein refolding chaperone|nr:hypothetical protein [Dysgonamonadaceae bacterium]
MKKTIKTALFFVLMSLVTLNISAQKTGKHQRAGAEDRGAKRTEWMTQQLNLSEAQQVEVKALYAKYAEKMKALKNDETKSKKDAKAQFKALREAQQAELKQILTSEQWEKLVTLKKEHQSQMTKQHKNKKGDRHNQNRSATTK